LRVAQRLPGTAALELSSRSHIRGGAEDEMAVRFDGVELVAPFHLEDYQSVFSAIDDRIVAGIQVYSGGFPAAYGGALSGLMLVEPRTASEPLAHELGLSFLYTSVLSSGTFGYGRGAWMGSVRRGNADVLLKDEEGDPAYRDVYAHVDLALGARHRIGVNALALDEDVRATPHDAPGDMESTVSDVHSRELWLRLDSDWSDELSSSTFVQTSRFSNMRRGSIADVDEAVGTVDDARRYDALGVEQSWTRDHGDQLLTFGFEWRSVDARFDYASMLELRGVLAALRPGAPSAYSATVVPDGHRYGAYASDRVRITSRIIVDLGLRWDRQSYVGASGDDQWSPRSSLLYRLGAQTDLRVSYGRFFQTERLLDLQIEDGVTEYADAQSATHSIIGVEHRFDDNIALRAEAFRKWTRSARPRYENLFDPLVLLPELRPDRVRIAPDRAEVRGVEVFVSGERPVAWWLSYSLSQAEDVFGAGRVPRSWDQRRALSGAVTWQAGPWALSSVLSVHSGWPTTELTLVDANGAATIAVGSRNARRLPSLGRLDFSAARDFATTNGALRFFSEVTNVTNRDNPCCVRYEPVTAGGATALVRDERRGLPLMANLGVLWSF
jgi:outer membrane receptor protein involved in Fe transport